MTAKLKTAVLGATGYSGLELTRILLRHPRLKTVSAAALCDNGSATDLADVFPALSGMAVTRCIRSRGLVEAAGSGVVVSSDSA